MDAEAYARLRDRCSAEHAHWATVARAVEQRTRHLLRNAGIEAEVSGRAKDPDSLLRKLVFKYDSDDLARVPDRAGARAVLHLPSDLQEACDLVRTGFSVVREDDVASSYDPDQFGYRGIHFDVRVDDHGIEPSTVTGDITCEIQVRTVAEHAWSVLSHLLVYKAPGEADLPKDLRRRIHRLVALVELFDQEAGAAREAIVQRPEYVVNRISFDVERIHNATVGDLLPSLSRCDPDLVAQLALLYRSEPEPWERIRAFAGEHTQRLRDVVSSYDLAVSPLIHQPEAFLLWERLDQDAVAVVIRWAETGYPIVLLENMATIWGVDLPDV